MVIMRKGLRAGAAGLILLAAAGCANDRVGENEAAGTILGAAGGGLLGAAIGGKGESKAVGAALGTFLGAAIGNAIGRKLDRADRIALEHAQQRALETAPSGTETEWYNPDTGHRGSITPEPAYQTAEGQYCREFTQTIIVGGEEAEGYGTACRQPDGSWKIVSSK
ncbi:MAG: RT0821/Lpp0805 family surface protein [Rhodothalassiaceae bacterium]